MKMSATLLQILLLKTAKSMYTSGIIILYCVTSDMPAWIYAEIDHENQADSNVIQQNTPYNSQVQNAAYTEYV